MVNTFVRINLRISCQKMLAALKLGGPGNMHVHVHAWLHTHLCAKWNNYTATLLHMYMPVSMSRSHVGGYGEFPWDESLELLNLSPLVLKARHLSGFAFCRG